MSDFFQGVAENNIGAFSGATAQMPTQASTDAQKALDEKNAKIAADRANYVALSKAKAGRAGLNLTDAARAGAGLSLPSPGGPNPSPYPFVTS